MIHPKVSLAQFPILYRVSKLHGSNSNCNSGGRTRPTTTMDAKPPQARLRPKSRPNHRHKANHQRKVSHQRKANRQRKANLKDSVSLQISPRASAIKTFLGATGDSTILHEAALRAVVGHAKAMA